MANEIKFQVLGDIKDLEKKMSDAKKSFDTLGKTSAVAFAGLTASALGFIESARQQELAINQLNQALKNSGNFSEEASVGLQKYASELQRASLFGDETIIQAQSLIASFGIEGEELKKLTKATLDLAQAKGMDLTSAADLVAKSVGSSTNALARYGVVIEGTSGSSQRVQTALSGINNLFEGQAEAATKGLGSIKQMQNAVSDLAEEIGGALAPDVIKLTEGITSLVDKMKENPEIAKTSAEILKFGIIVTGATAGIWAIASAIGSMTTAVTGLNSAMAFLAANPAIMVLGGLAVAAGGVAYAANDLANAWKKANEEIDKQIDYQNKMLEYYNASDKEGTYLGRLEIINAISKAEAEAAQRRIDDERRVNEEIESMKTEMQAIAATRTQQELNELIEKYNFQRDAEIKFIEMKQQLLQNNQALTLEQEELFRQQKAEINARYDAIEFEGRQQIQNRLNDLEKRGLELAKQVNSDKIGNLQTTLQQAAQLNSKFANAFKAVAIGQTIVNTAMGIMAAMSGPPNGPPFPVNIALAALIGGMGAVQIATIAQQQFAVGTPEIPRDMTATVHQGEMIVPATFSDAIRSGDLTLSGGENQSGGGVVFNFSGASFNGVTETFVREIFENASEMIYRRTMTPLPA